MKKTLLAVVFLAVSSVGVMAQTGPRFEGGLNFNVGNPIGEFGDQIEDPGFGGSLWAGAGLSTAPILVGVDFGFLIYGRERRVEPFSTTIPDVTVEVVTENNIATGHLFVRLQPPSGAFRPYGDAFVGFNYLFTDTRIRNEGFSDEDIARSTNFDDTALSYGFGGGVQIEVWNAGDRRTEEGPKAVSIDLGVRYQLGTQASYLSEGSIRREGTRVTFDVTDSETSLMVFNLGVGFRF